MSNTLCVCVCVRVISTLTESTIEVKYFRLNEVIWEIEPPSCEDRLRAGAVQPGAGSEMAWEQLLSI